MKIYLIVGIAVLAVVGSWFAYVGRDTEFTNHFTDGEVGFESVEDVETSATSSAPTSFSSLTSEFISTLTRGARWAAWWREFTPDEQAFYNKVKRPLGPAHVGIQVGHWKNVEVPEELEGLKRNGSGASGGGTTEVVVVLSIAQKVQKLLEARGVVVDLLPATVPQDYFADAFVSIHADGNSNTSVSGFKIAAPQRDFSGKSEDLKSILDKTYEASTKLSEDSNITRRMSGYYAFNWRRYDHAVSPLTPAVIVETGFLSSPTDRKIIVSAQDRAAKGIADGLIEFLTKQGLL